MAATPTSLTLERRLRRQLDKILDAQTRDLVRAWAIAWDEIAPELRDTLTQLLVDTNEPVASRGVLGKSSRLLAALSVIADTLADLAPAAGVRINQDLQSVVDDAARAQARIVSAQLPTGQDLVDLDKRWTKKDADALQAIVKRSAEQITALHQPLAPEAYQAVRRELVRSVAIGANPRATAARMVRRAEVEFNGGLTRALTISRTEVLDAHRAAAKAGQDRQADVLQGWVWLAHLSPRTCRACLAMNGREFPLEEPGPIGHQQCRCARSPKVKTWADLGFDVEEPASAIPDAGAYFERLTPDEQRRILGRKGYDAWVAGDFPMNDWARRREAAGWRDSVVPASPADPSKGDGGAGSDGGNGPPGDPPSSPLDDDPEGFPIGAVLGTPEQQQHWQWPDDVMPLATQIDAYLDDSANSVFTYVPEPDARATAVLQYEHATQRFAKDLAMYIDAGDGIPDKWLDATELYYLNWMRGVPRFGIEADGSNYSYDDFFKDLSFTAQWLLDRLEVKEALPPLFRGICVQGDFDLDDPLDLEKLALKVIPGFWFDSCTSSLQIAEAYAKRVAGTQPVIILLDGAMGFRLDGVGRLSPVPEFLVEGVAERVSYSVINGILYVMMRQRS